MIKGDPLQDVLQRYDPAQTLSPVRLAQLETRIIDQVLHTEQRTTALSGALTVNIWVRTEPLWGAALAFALMMLGVFVGQDLPSLISEPVTVKTTKSISVLTLATPWQNWIEEQGGAAHE